MGKSATNCQNMNFPRVSYFLDKDFILLKNVILLKTCKIRYFLQLNIERLTFFGNDVF